MAGVSLTVEGQPPFRLIFFAQQVVDGDRHRLGRLGL